MNKTQQDIENINTLLLPYGLSVTSHTESTRVNQYRVSLPVTIDINKLLRLKNNFKIAVNDSNVTIKQDNTELVIETKGNNKIITMQDCFNASMRTPDNQLRLVLGQDISGQNVLTSLIKAPHILVSGCTGSGKSQMLHSFISSILLGNKSCILILIDPKGVEFKPYKDIDTVKFIDNTPDAIQITSWLAEQMDLRYKYMQEHDIDDVSNSNDPNLKRIVIIIDEFADLIQSDKNIEKPIVRLAQKARACGIHLIIGTQYPKKEVITGLIQANIPTRICLKTETSIQSKVAIGRTGGEKLLGHGDLLFLGNGMYEPIRIQAPYFNPETKKEVAEEAQIRFKGHGGYVTSDPDFYKPQNKTTWTNEEAIEQIASQPTEQTKPQLSLERKYGFVTIGYYISFIAIIISFAFSSIPITAALILINLVLCVPFFYHKNIKKNFRP